MQGKGGAVCLVLYSECYIFFQHKSHKNVKICDLGYKDEIN